MLYIFHAAVFYTTVLFPATLISLVFMLLHVSATYWSHYQAAITL